jgi:hypothetical protein
MVLRLARLVARLLTASVPLAERRIIIRLLQRRVAPRTTSSSDTLWAAAEQSPAVYLPMRS